MNIFLAPWRWANDVALRLIVKQTIDQWEREDKAAAKAEEDAKQAEEVAWNEGAPDFYPTYPHCDSNILHAPGACVYCDRRPDMQADRRFRRINYTNHHDPLLAPCPSEYFRPAEVRDLWHGNIAMTQEHIDEDKAYWYETVAKYYSDRDN